MSPGVGLSYTGHQDNYMPHLQPGMGPGGGGAVGAPFTLPPAVLGAGAVPPVVNNPYHNSVAPAYSPMYAGGEDDGSSYLQHSQHFAMSGGGVSPKQINSSSNNGGSTISVVLIAGTVLALVTLAGASIVLVYEIRRRRQNYKEEEEGPSYYNKSKISTGATIPTNYYYQSSSPLGRVLQASPPYHQAAACSPALYPSMVQQAPPTIGDSSWGVVGFVPQTN